MVNVQEMLPLCNKHTYVFNENIFLSLVHTDKDGFKMVNNVDLSPFGGIREKDRCMSSSFQTQFLYTFIMYQKSDIFTILCAQVCHHG